MTDSLLDIWGMRQRGKRDSARHSKRVKKAIKDNLRDLVSDASIISSDGKKKVKIPIKYLDQYRFKYADDKNQERVGQGNSDNKPGDQIAHDGTGTGKPTGGVGDKDGDVVYEEEVELAEIIQMMLEDMNLPWLESKDDAVETETEDLIFSGISEVGQISNIDKKTTIFQNMRRNAAAGKAEIKNIKQDDLRYKVWEVEKEYHSNAAVYLLMDRSGSMDEDRKYIAKSFFFWLAHFCRTKYGNVDLIFIAHDTTAKIVPEENFFEISNSGGTKCSSAFELALDNINKNHPPDKWNNYVFSFSDGDNWGDDNKKCVKLVEDLLDVCSAVGYGEINIDNFFGWGKSSSFSWSTLHDEFSKSIDNPKFITAEISDRDNIYECLKQFLGINNEAN